MLPSALTTDSPADLRGIAAWLGGYSGISTAIIGSHSLKRAVEQRLAVTGVANAELYLDFLLGSPAEQQELVELVVVPETWFFRDRHPYAYLREYVGRLLQHGLPSQPLRLLSAPCSSGEEPYSMAMSLLEMGLPRESFRIDAIDISRQSLRRARQAVYGKHSFRGVSEAEQQLHFQATASGLALLLAIRQSVHFRRANLMDGLAQLARPYDVIFCRNLLIYLEEAASQRLLETLAGLMNGDGLLIVGSAEAGKVPTALFEAIRAPFVFGFRRRDDQAIPPPLATLPAVAPSSGAVTRPGSRDRSSGLPGNRPDRSRRSTCPRPPLATSGVPAPERQHFERELERNPCSDAAYLQQAHWLLSQDRAHDALESLQKCLYLKPDSREALKVMIQITRQLGQVERSRHLQGRLARLEP